jgi:hypothetical protein
LKNEKVRSLIIDKFNLPEGDGRTFAAIKGIFPKICVIIVKQDEVDTAVQALGMGADYYMITDELFAGSLSEICSFDALDFFRYGFDDRQRKGFAAICEELAAL